MKKLLKISGVVLALLLVAIVVIPLVVDVDKYRPQLVGVANQHLNGKLEVGKLKLSLWGRVLVNVDGVKLFDAGNNKVVSVNQAHFHIPFSSLLAGSPSITFKMENPEIIAIKDKAGKLNLLSLVKPATVSAAAPSQPSAASPAAAPATGKTAAPQVQAPAPQAAAPAPAAPSAPSAGSSQVALPALATRARLGVELRGAHVSYTDLATGLKSDTKDLNLILRDISLSRPMELELWAELNTQMAGTFQVTGPARLTGEIRPTLSGTQFEKAQIKLNLNLDGLEIAAPGKFVKAKGVPTNAQIAATVTPKDADIEKFNFKFHNADISATAKLTNLPAPNVKADISSNVIQMGPWVELLPAMKGFDLSGTLQLKAAANGPTDKLTYSANIDLSKLSAKAPMLKEKPEINADIQIVTDQVRKMLITFKAPGNDLKINGSVVSFAKPRIQVSVDSPGLDLDRLIDWPAAPKKGAWLDKLGVPAAHAAGGNQPDPDAALASLRSNAALREMVADVTLSIKELKAKGTSVKDIASKFTFRNLVANLEKFDLSVFSGRITTKLVADLKPAQPTYSIDATISKLDLKEAVTSQLQLFKNTVYGKMTMTAKGSGSSFNPDVAKQRLNVKGNLKIEDAVFASIDVAKMVGEALENGLSKVGDKVPGLKGKQMPKLPNRESKYESVTSDFTIAGGRFSAPNFYAKAAKGSGVDLKGDTGFGLADQSLLARWEVIDAQNLTKARDISVDISGTKVEHVLAKGNDPFSFPVTVKGTLSSPDYSYGEVPEHFAKVAMSNMTGAAKNKARDELTKRIGEQAPAPAKKLLEGFGKKLFR